MKFPIFCDTLEFLSISVLQFVVPSTSKTKKIRHENFDAMPTLRWIRRPKSSASAASIDSSVTSTRSAEAVPDTVAFSSASVVPAGSSTQSAEARSHAEILVDFQRLIEQARPDGGQKRKRTMSPSAKAAMAAEKKCKATSKRDLPTGVYKTSSGKRFVSVIRWGSRTHHIGCFDTPEQASAAYLSVKKDLFEGANLPAVGADKANDLFYAARKRAAKEVGGVFIPRTKRAKTTSDRDLPTGVQKTPSGKIHARIQWGGKSRYIGTFNAPEQASATYVSVKEDLGDIELSSLGADEINAAFDAVKKRALEAVGGVFNPRKRAEATSERDLPTGVRKLPSGRFKAKIHFGGTNRGIGTFDTPEQASAVYTSMRNVRNDIELSALGADEVTALFDAAKKKAVETVGALSLLFSTRLVRTGAQ